MFSANAVSIGYGLATAVTWGAADFSGGLGAKKANVFRVVLVAHGAGLLFMLGLAWLSGEPVPSSVALGWGMLAGLSGGFGVLCLYQALAVGTMGTVAPIAAVITAALPVIFGEFTQGKPRVVQVAGFVLAFIAIVLISKPEKIGTKPKGLGLAILAGIGFGVFVILVKQAGSISIFWPLVSARAASFVLVLMIVLFSRRLRSDKAAPGALAAMIAAGIMDSVGNLLLVMATRSGRLDVAAVLSSLYPASTVVLAYVILKERVTRIQNVGILTALIAVPMIAW